MNVKTRYEIGDKVKIVTGTSGDNRFIGVTGKIAHKIKHYSKKHIQYSIYPDRNMDDPMLYKGNNYGASVARPICNMLFYEKDMIPIIKIDNNGNLNQR